MRQVSSSSLSVRMWTGSIVEVACLVLKWLNSTATPIWRHARSVLGNIYETLTPGWDCLVDVTCLGGRRSNLMLCCLSCDSRLTILYTYREAVHVFDHTTSRVCDDLSCRGTLHDSIINFGESLPEDELIKAFDHAKKVSTTEKNWTLGKLLRLRIYVLVGWSLYCHGFKSEGAACLLGARSCPWQRRESSHLQVSCWLWWQLALDCVTLWLFVQHSESPSVPSKPSDY